MTDNHRTFYSEHGLVEDIVVQTYSQKGDIVSNASNARYMQTGSKAEPGTYMRPPPKVVQTFTELPFAKLVVP